MGLLNYTTKVSVDRSVAEIMKMLTKFGAQRIMVENDDTGTIVGMSFEILVDGAKTGYKLPVKWEEVLYIIDTDGRVPRAKKNPEHAKCVAWRILKDWVEAQLAILETNMVKLDQVFLPYAIAKSGKTIYEHVKSVGLLAAPKDA